MVLTTRIGINGFGRIGRLVARVIEERHDLELVAINDLVPADNLAYLLKYDSMHGIANNSINNTSDKIIYGGNEISCFNERNPSDIPWGNLGIDYVLESTGFFTTQKDASAHLDAGAKRVLISAPTKSPEEVPTLVYKVNHEKYDSSKHKIISNASCTTNCLAPITKIILDNFGLEEGLMTTVHAATATQPTQDGPSKKDMRGGRNAYMNIIPASTGAAKAVGLCLPEVRGKLTGMAFRVPTANVSVVDLTFKTTKPTSIQELNSAMKEASEKSMVDVLGYTEDPIVSSDLVGDPRSSVYDATAGIELNNQFLKIISWYDNEFGYANRCADMLAYLASSE